MADEPYNRTGNGNGLTSRVRLLEWRMDQMDRKLDEILANQKREQDQRAWSRGEKIAFTAAMASVGIALLAFATFGISAASGVIVLWLL